MEVHCIVQEAVIKTIPKKNKCKKAKWLSEEALHIAEKRREAKGKGKKIYPSECRVLKNCKEGQESLSEQCKEIDENNGMGKTRDLFKKIGDKEGTFLTKMSTIKDRNGMDLTEANRDGVITHLEPDLMECEVKWALGSITANKTSGGDGIPAELFQILKDNALKVLHLVCQQIWKILHNCTHFSC